MSGHVRRWLTRPVVGFWVRSADAKDYSEAFLVSAVTTIVVVRLALVASGYPKLGGKGVHIAHLLWGGLLMMVAIVVATGLLSRAARQVACVVGGIGFGLFIDEIGKFVTSDNNYFFRPAYSLIYIVLVLVWLGTRQLFTAKALTARESLANAIDELKESAIRNVSANERARALRLAERADPADELAREVLELLKRIDTIAPLPPPEIARFLHRLTAFYWWLVGKREFARVVAVVFVVLTAVEVYRVVDLSRIAIRAADARGSTFHSVDRAVNGRDLGFSGWATLGSSALVAALFLAGIAALFRHSRLEGYHWFERGLFASIFLAQVFDFADLQVAAFAILALDLLLLATIRFMLTREEHPPAS